MRALNWFNALPMCASGFFASARRECSGKTDNRAEPAVRLGRRYNSAMPGLPRFRLAGWSGSPMTAPGIQSPAHSELRHFIDHVPALGWSALVDGSLEYVNQRFRDYTGLSADELYGSGWKSAVHRDDIQPLESWLQELIQSREAGTTEVRLRRFDGSYRWFLVFANPLRDESGSVIAWYGTNIDIEDRKQAEATLRASELSWRQIIDNIPGFVNTAGATGAPEFFNRPEQEYFGKTNEELKDWGRIGVIHPEDLPGVIEAWATSLETGQNLDIEARFRRADGVYRWFQMRAVPARDAEGKIRDWYALHTDIDDRKKTEEALQSSERNLRLLINTIPTFIGVLRTDGSVLYANQTILDYTGLTPEDVQKEDFRSRMFHPEDVERLRDEQGRIDRWYAAAFDIEDRKRAENVRLEERTRIARELHDTLLQTFLGASMQLGAAVDVLPKELPVKQRLDRVLQIMSQGIEEGRSTIQGLRSGDFRTLDLVVALSGVQRELPVQPDIDFRVSVIGREQPLNPSIQEEMYRIGREALLNAFCHSRAERVELELEYADQGLQM